MAIAFIPPWLQELPSSEISNIAAWWGAIVATLCLFWNILRDVRAKGRLKVEGIYEVHSLNPLSRSVLAVRVSNVGSKPILVQGIAIQLKKGSVPSHHFFPCESPKMLAPDKFFLQVLDRSGWLPTGTEKLYAWDSTGRHWYMARKEFRRLLEQHRQFVTAAESRSITGLKPQQTASNH